MLGEDPSHNTPRISGITRRSFMRPSIWERSSLKTFRAERLEQSDKSQKQTKIKVPQKAYEADLSL
jgi:hypothetical protein